MKYTGRIVITLFFALLALGTRTYGVLYYGFPPNQFPLITIFALLVSWFMGTQYDKLKFLSEKDVLTSLYNRRFLLLAFPKLIALADRKQEKLILYFIDVDEFKIINDSRGHEIGDQVLRRVANVLKLHSHNKDLVVRWAGDEFLILSPFADDRSKVRMITHIQDELKLVSHASNIAISVSIGTALYPNAALTLDDLLHEADQDMYTMKSDKIT